MKLQTNVSWSGKRRFEAEALGGAPDRPAVRRESPEGRVETSPAGWTPLSARAVANIAEWSTYLPKECVDAMIRDGWHLTA